MTQPVTEPLTQALTTAHATLTERLDAARQAMRDRLPTREVIARTDTFLAQACRHAAAVCDLLLPAAQRALPGGQERVNAYVEQCRRLERAMGRAKQRMYGEAHTVASTWTEVWTAVLREFAALRKLELALVRDLVAADPDHGADVARRLHLVTDKGPTRPHPLSPHVGRFARVARAFWSRADRVWDSAEGRVVTVRPPAEPESLAS